MANEKTVEWAGSQPVWNYLYNADPGGLGGFSPSYLEDGRFPPIRARATTSGDGTTKVTLNGPNILLSFGERGAGFTDSGSPSYMVPSIVITYNKDGRVSAVERRFTQGLTQGVLSPESSTPLKFTQNAKGEVIIEALPGKSPTDAAKLSIHLRMVNENPEIEVKREFIASDKRGKQETYRFTTNQEATFININGKRTTYNALGIGGMRYSADRQEVYAPQAVTPIPIGWPPVRAPRSQTPENLAGASIMADPTLRDFQTIYYPSGTLGRDLEKMEEYYKFSHIKADGSLDISHAKHRGSWGESIYCRYPSMLDNLSRYLPNLLGGRSENALIDGTELTPKMTAEIQEHLRLLNNKLRSAGLEEVPTEGNDVCAIAANVVKNLKARLAPPER